MKPVILCILDGVGLRNENHGNAFKIAKKPNFDFLFKKYPHSLLEASGELVGLPENQMGNSEVGHMNIGAGRIVYQPLDLISKSIEDKTFFNNEKILNIMKHVKKNKSRLQIFGLISDGGVHSHINHLFSILEMCKKEQINEVYLHLFTDGRDTSPVSSLKYLDLLKNKINELNIGIIASISGRYYAMDRDNRWDRIELAYNTYVRGQGNKYNNYQELINDNYKKDLTDEFIIPGVIEEKGCIKDNDGLLVFNYRPDRLRELFSALTNPNFASFETEKFKNIKLITMMSVSDEVIHEHAFDHLKLNNTLGEYISDKNLKQLRIAETEKYAHVTYFFDGGIEKELKNCDRILIPSPKVTTYDLKPDMSAYEITDKLLEKIDEDIYDFIVVNYANCDMVGHTGNMKKTIEAVEHIDKCLGRLYEKTKEKNGLLIITADHGNSDKMLDENEKIVTSHSTSLVPLIITSNDYKLKNGKLADIAPNILKILNLPIPKEMNGNILIQKTKKNNKKYLMFNIISVIFLLILVGTYAYRLNHYYKLEHPKVIENDNRLVSKIITKDNLVSSKDGLYSIGEEYIYKGKVENNYVYYSNRYYRIVKINEDKTIKLITDDIVTSMVWNYDNNDYSKSSIDEWLNPSDKDNTGIFYNSLNNPDMYLDNNKICIDKVSDNYDKCKNVISNKVGLLSIKEYKDALANNSYLNIGKYFWTSNASLDGNVFYVFTEGGINSKSKEGSTYYSYGVRPVITLKEGTSYIKGDGTKNNPYIIEENSNLSIGSYIKYNNSLWKLYKIEEKSFKFIKEENIVINNKNLEYIYSTKSSEFNKNEYGSLAYYLNNTYYNSLKQKNLLINEDWYNGEYSEEKKYDYKTILNEKVQSKIGLISVSELSDFDSEYTTMTKANESMIYVVTKEGKLEVKDINTKLLIRPSIAITKDINIKEGNGTKENPFIIE